MLLPSSPYTVDWWIKFTQCAVKNCCILHLLYIIPAVYYTCCMLHLLYITPAVYITPTVYYTCCILHLLYITPAVCYTCCIYYTYCILHLLYITAAVSTGKREVLSTFHVVKSTPELRTPEAQREVVFPSS